MKIKFDQLEKASLVVDAIYEGGTAPGKASEVISKLMEGCSNSGGFRKVLRKDGSGKIAYVVLYTTMDKLEWPDFLDEETGVFRYYGDNKKPGKALLDTPRKGNALLEDVYGELNRRQSDYSNIPPFFVFKKAKSEGGWDVQFLGLAAPGNQRISPDKDLVAFWRTMGDKRFQNYEAYFTILNTGKEAISREWIHALIYDNVNSQRYAPDVWKSFIRYGRNGIVALKAPKIARIPTKYDQLQSDVEGRKCLEKIRNHYRSFPQGFEACAVDLMKKISSNYVDFSLTRPWRDGGRDAVGYYSLGAESKSNHPLKIDCALEAKCYSENSAVGVRQMSRLISRIRYRQFGIMMTTSYVDSQAYSEVVDDQHPILIITAADIAGVLRKNSINSNDITEWLDSIESPWFDGI